MKPYGAIAVMLGACLLLGGCSLVDGGAPSGAPSGDTGLAGGLTTTSLTDTASMAGGDTGVSSGGPGESSESSSLAGDASQPEPGSGGSENTLDDIFAAAKAAYDREHNTPLGAGEDRVLLNIHIIAGDASAFVAEAKYYETVFDTCCYETLEDERIEYTKTRDYKSYLSTVRYRIEWEDGRYQTTDTGCGIDLADLEAADFTKVYSQLTEKQRDLCQFGPGDALQLTYDCGESWIDAPYTKEVVLDRGDSYDGLAHLQDGCSFMRDGLSAFVFGGSTYQNVPVTVAVTYDQGRSFTEVQLPESINARKFSIGFLPGENQSYGPDSFGWLVVGHDRLMSKEALSVYFTHDGGRSWENSHALDDQFSTLFSGAAFASEKVGYLCFTSISGDYSWTLRTVDGGQGWENFYLPLPDSVDKDHYAIALTPVFEGNQGVFELRPIENRRARLLSDDGGLTWQFDKIYIPGASEGTDEA